jgi:DNA adenine methylase
VKQDVYPFVKWAGGKSQLLNILERYIPDNFNNYFEPFVGGGSFFYRLVKLRDVRSFSCFLSDSNCELINAYAVVKLDVDELIKSLKRHEELYYNNPKDYYYELRATATEKKIEKASRFITLNKTCFNGLYRVNRKGFFNVPMGKFKKLPKICDEKNLKNLNSLLNIVNPVIECQDYKEALSRVSENDFIYLDPPYKPMSETAYFTKYTNYGFVDEDQTQLASIFKELDKLNCKILLSNSNTELIRDLYKDYNLKEVKAIRAINCKGSKRLGHTELIISNY